MEFTRGIETLGGISLVKRGGPVRPEIWPISEKLNFPAALAYTRKPSGQGGFNNMLHLNTFFTRPQRLLEMQLYADLHLLVCRPGDPSAGKLQLSFQDEVYVG